VESWFKHIHSTCRTTDDIKKIEDTLDLGQIEEVIENAKDELGLIDYYFEHKGWELVKVDWRPLLMLFRSLCTFPTNTVIPHNNRPSRRKRIKWFFRWLTPFFSRIQRTIPQRSSRRRKSEQQNKRSNVQPSD